MRLRLLAPREKSPRGVSKGTISKNSDLIFRSPSSVTGKCLFLTSNFLNFLYLFGHLWVDGGFLSLVSISRFNPEICFDGFTRFFFAGVKAKGTAWGCWLGWKIFGTFSNSC